MKLKKISYSEFVGGSQEWFLNGLTLGNINLLVGKNATGKSRCLNLINGLAKLLSGSEKKLFTSGSFDAEFENDRDEIRYVLEIKNTKIVQESFVLNGKNLMTRGQGGAGQIFAEEVDGGKMLSFHAPETLVAAVVRQDEIQHKFLRSLNTWAKGVIHYEFGSPMGKNQVALIQKEVINELDLRETSKVVSFFLRGEKKYEDAYIKAIKEDLEQIHYYIEEIGTKQPSFHLPPDLQGEPRSLYVKERDLTGITEQFSMSQGMFRVLSLIIQVNYCQMAGQPSCILIDDIGEGLDFERSVGLVKLLMEKVKSPVQLIMATNDKFIMNKVPLETWCVLKREANKCNVYNYANSKEKFDEFKFTGMNNFDLLMTDFLGEGYPKDE